MTKIFVGRQYYLNKFDEFLISESLEPKNRILLLQGDEGMGKTALLQAMAVRAAKRKHILAFGNLYHEQSDFFNQIYPIIAQIELKQQLKLGEASDWLKFGIIGFTAATVVIFPIPVAALFGAVFQLGTLGIDIKKEEAKKIIRKTEKRIRKTHENMSLNNQSLAELFLGVLLLRANKIDSTDRIVIFLDPEKLTPMDVIPLLKQMVKELPSQVRFVIAQRNNDCLVEAYGRGELRNVCKPPLVLGFLQEGEEVNFIDSYDPDHKLGETVRASIITKYKGWPLLLSLATEELLRIQREIIDTDVDDLPSDIDGIWEGRYKRIQDENALKLLHIVCLLPHPYTTDRLAEFCQFSNTTVAAILHNTELMDILIPMDFKDTLYSMVRESCPYPKHLTAKDYIKKRLEQNPALKCELTDDIIGTYQSSIGEDLERSSIDPDAIVNLLLMILDNNLIDDFLFENNRLTPIKLRYGLLDSCLKNMKEALFICTERKDKACMATQYGNMGIVYKIQGDLGQALRMHEKALDIFSKIARKDGVADQLGNIGNIYQISGDLVQAIKMYEKVIKINRELGRKKCVASSYGNLGIVYQDLGKLDQAYKMYDESLKLYLKLGEKEGAANQYNNIGIIHKTRGSFDLALEMYQKSLEINMEIAYKMGMARNYTNIGTIYKLSGNRNQALDMFQKALTINKELGQKEGTAIDYANIGKFYLDKGDFDQALEMHQKSLEINIELGCIKGMATGYGSIGNIFLRREKFDKALEMYEESLKLNMKIGVKEGIATDNYNIGNIYIALGDLTKTKQCWEKSLEIFNELKAIPQLERVKNRLSSLNF